MILGKIFGKTTTTKFKFIVTGKAKKFDFIQVHHPDYGYVLCQITEIERDEEKTVASCFVIGYKDDGHIKRPRVPFHSDTEVLLADNDFIGEIIKLDKSDKGAYIGLLDGKKIKVFLDLKKLLTKHIAILAKTGAGKSYAAGVLLEEIMDKKVPLLIIDPHGEYSIMRFRNDDKKDLSRMRTYGVDPKAYKNIQEYGDVDIIKDAIPIRLNSTMSHSELLHLMPKLSGTQTGILYNASKELSHVSFEEILLNLEIEENNAKYTLMNNLDYLNKTHLFSNSFTSYNELVRSGRCSIVNLKGMAQDLQEIIVYKLLHDLFEARKKELIPPFFLIIEESHNYCPERSFGETKCSRIIRTIAAEGRKFGLGLCVISQRPARIDKSVLSQCTTQIILKVTNPNDLKAIAQSVEGITSEAQDEIKNLPIGTALVTGVVDMPLFVNIRTRKSKHGGVAVNILPTAKDENFFEKMEKFEEKDLLPLVKPKISLKDVEIMSGRKIKKAEVYLIPSYLFLCKDKKKEFNILVETVKGDIVLDVDSFKTASLPELSKLTKQELKVLQESFKLGTFSFEDFISKTGFNISVKQQLNDLIKKGYLVVSNSKIKLSEKYILTNLSKKSSYVKINFEAVKYTKKVNSRISLDSLKKKLSKFTEVVDQRQCYILQYRVQYES